MKAFYNIDGTHEELEFRACRTRGDDVCAELGLVSSCRVSWCDGSRCNNGTEYVIEEEIELSEEDNEPRRIKKIEMFFIVLVPTMFAFFLIAVAIYFWYR